MGQFLGVDFGTSAIKAAVSGHAAMSQSLVMLESDDSFLPVAVESPKKATGTWICGSDAYSQRRIHRKAVATDFRDELVETSAKLELNGRVTSGCEILTELFTSLAARLQESVPDARATCVTIPDSWKPGTWTLPVALHQAGWRPRLLVREFAAVLASQTPDTDEVVLLSLGYGPFRGTRAVRRDSKWNAESTAADLSVSGKLLRQRLSGRLADEMVAETRYNPQENSEADQALEDAIERVLRRLPFEERTELSLEMKGRSFHKQILRSELADWAADFQSSLKKLLERLGVQKDGHQKIVAWGELTRILPVHEWLTGWNLVVAPPTCVAIGASQVCDWFCRREGSALSLPGVSTVDGTWRDSSLKRTNAANVTPVLQFLPTDWSEGAPCSKSTARLVQFTQIGSKEVTPLTDGNLRLGRHPSIEVTFDPVTYPQVSQYHAAIQLQNGRYVISDLGSTNGTYVNDQRVISPVCLDHGDVIRLGQNDPQLRFESNM